MAHHDKKLQGFYCEISGFLDFTGIYWLRQIESRNGGTERDLRHIESWDSETVPGLTGILVPRYRDLMSRGI